MICPACKTKYREGFTRCADCGVELVEVLPGGLVAPESGAAVDGGEQEDPFCEFWRGDDARLQGELCQVLEEAGIPVRTLQLNDVLSMVGIPSRQAIFRMGVPFSMFERAEKAVIEAFGGVDEADATLYPTLENRPELRKLIEMPQEEKPKGTGEEPTTFWDDVTWRRQRKKDDEEEQ